MTKTVDDSKTICTIKEVQNILNNISASCASDKIRLLRSALGKEKPKIVTLKEFKDYYGIE